MSKQRKYITFYQLKFNYGIPYIKKYGMMCKRNWWKSFKLGMRHIRQGKAILFRIQKAQAYVY